MPVTEKGADGLVAPERVAAVLPTFWTETAAVTGPPERLPEPNTKILLERVRCGPGKIPNECRGKVRLPKPLSPIVKVVEIEPLVDGANTTGIERVAPGRSDIGEVIGFTEKEPGATASEVTVTAVVARRVTVELRLVLAGVGAIAVEMAASGAGAATPKP